MTQETGGASQVTDVRIERHLPASPETVFRAWTEATVIERWFCPNPDLLVTATADPVVGGSYRVRMGADHVAEGVYTDLVAARLVSFTWCWTSSPDEVSRVRVELAPAPDGGTDLVLLHTGLADADDVESQAEGWQLSLARLERLELPGAV